MNETEENRRAGAAAAPTLTLPIVIGRKYVRRDGVVVQAQKPHHNIVPPSAYAGHDDPEDPYGATHHPNRHVFLATGRVWEAGAHDNDLVADYVEAPAVPDGFTAWGGGEQPAETRGFYVDVLLRDGSTLERVVSYDLRWNDDGSSSDIIAYKLADEQPAAEPATAPAEAAGHPHATQMAQYAEDAAKAEKPWLLWERRSRDLAAGNSWFPLSSHPEWKPGTDYRRKQRIIVVNGIEVQAGQVCEPKKMERCYCANPAHSAWAYAFCWTGDRIHHELLQRGLVYLGWDAAVARAKAMAATQEAA